MGNDSAYSATSPRRVYRFVNKFNDIRNYPGKKQVTFLMVEGPSDKRLFERFVDEAKCHIEDIGDRDAVIRVLSLLEQRAFPGILAIVDADFEVLMNRFPATSNLIFTDTHDIETMIIKSSAFERVLDFFCTQEKIENLKARAGRDDIRAIITECGKPIGFLRYISKLQGLDLKFKDINFQNFTNIDEFTLNVEALIENVAVNSHNHTDKLQGLNITREKIRTEIEQLEKSNLDQWYICHGHDLTQILSIAFHKYIGKSHSKYFSSEEIEKILVLAFDISHFEKTDLYRSIIKWENTNEPYKILRTHA